MHRKRFRYTKEERLAAGWLSIREVAAEVRVKPETLRYHVTMGYCQRPTKRIGNRFFYTKETFSKLMEYWATREPHQHHPRSYKYGRLADTSGGGT